MRGQESARHYKNPHGIVEIRTTLWGVRTRCWKSARHCGNPHALLEIRKGVFKRPSQKVCPFHIGASVEVLAGSALACLVWFDLGCSDLVCLACLVWLDLGCSDLSRLAGVCFDLVRLSQPRPG